MKIPVKDLGHVSIGEDIYRADFELLDRYIAFSAELVRLALLGFGALGFYLKEFVAKDGAGKDLPPPYFVHLLALAAVILGITAGAGLLHRYYATDGMYHHLKSIRFASTDLHAREDLLKSVKPEADRRNKRYALANRWLVTSECALIAGVGVSAVALAARFTNKSENTSYIAAALVVLACAAASLGGWLRYFRAHSRSEEVSDKSRDGGGLPSNL